MLDYKAENAGKLTIDVCPKNTSQNCSNCKKKVPKGLSTPWHKCIYGGTVLQRDHNAARNILARGIETLLADGLAVIVPGGLALAGSVNGEPENPLSSIESRSLTPLATATWSPPLGNLCNSLQLRMSILYKAKLPYSRFIRLNNLIIIVSSLDCR